jgi:deoxyribonuclease V
MIEIKKHHQWNLDYKEAVKLQKRLSGTVILKDSLRKVKKIAGVDVRYIKKSDKILCAVLVFSYPSLEIIEERHVFSETTFPYIPGLLSFREGPVVEKCFAKIKNKPDLVFFDGHGYAHPRRFGLASHMGVILDIASIGCAKNLLCGDYDKLSLNKEKGSYSYIFDGDEIIGAALRTRDNAKPVFVSAGNKISLDSAIKYTLSVSKYRIPEPVRLAHNYLKNITVF